MRFLESKTQNNYDKASYARKVYNTMVKEAKQKYMLGKLKEHEKDQNKILEKIKVLLHSMTNRKVEEILNHVGDLCTGKEANDVMNEYFINIGKDLASKLPDSHFDYNINGVCSLQLSVFDEFTNEILFKILNETSLKGICPEFQVIRGFSQKIPAGLLSYDQIHS